MLTWLHCNLCYSQPVADQPPFLITSCGHIYCSKCVERVPAEKCSMCQKAFTTAKLNAELKQEYLDFFQDPMELFNKAINVANFQNSQGTRYVSKMRGYHGKYLALKAEATKMAEENNRLRKTNKNNQLQIGWLQKELSEVKKQLRGRSTENQRTPSSSGSGDFLMPKTPWDSRSARSDFSFPGQTPRGLPTGSAASKYRTQPTFTPIEEAPSPATPSETPFSQRNGGGAYTRGSSISTIDRRLGAAGLGNDRRIESPGFGTNRRDRDPSGSTSAAGRHYISPSVLRPLNYQDRFSGQARRKM